MPLQDQTKQMESVVTRLLAEIESEQLEDHWELAKQLLGDLPVRAFYAVNGDGYINVAILTDKAIIDVEASDEGPESNDIDVILIRSIGGVSMRPGSVQTLPDTEDSQLTLVLSLIGATDAGSYWFAEDAKEKARLARFGQALMEVMNQA